MMKRTIFASITLLSCLALATAFTACKEEPKDTTKPIIELIEPEDHDKLLIGDENGVHFEMKLSDDDLVKSYKIDIHNNFDGHSHTRDLRHGDDKTKPRSTPSISATPLSTTTTSRYRPMRLLASTTS